LKRKEKGAMSEVGGNPLETKKREQKKCLEAKGHGHIEESVGERGGERGREGRGPCGVRIWGKEVRKTGERREGRPWRSGEVKKSSWKESKAFASTEALVRGSKGQGRRQ